MKAVNIILFALIAFSAYYILNVDIIEVPTSAILIFASFGLGYTIQSGPVKLVKAQQKVLREAMDIIAEQNGAKKEVEKQLEVSKLNYQRLLKGHNELKEDHRKLGLMYQQKIKEELSDHVNGK